MKKALVQLARSLGFHVYTDGSLPTGVSWIHDIGRLGLRSPVCFDIGANIGQTVHELLARFPDSTIYSFEPVRSTYLELVRNVSRHARVHPFQLALGSMPGKVEIALKDKSVLNSLVATPTTPAMATGGRVEEITVSTVDRFCAEKQIERLDILKTDTEGFDAEVLRGADTMLSSGRIAYVYSEVTLLDSNPSNTSFDSVFRYLSARDYRFLGLYETYPLVHFEEPNTFCNALFARRG